MRDQENSNFNLNNFRSAGIGSLLAMACVLSGVSCAADESDFDPNGDRSDENTPLPDHRDLPWDDAPPDPFLMFSDGSFVQTTEDWYQRRRPELGRLFENYVYGVMPGPKQPIAELVQSFDDFLGGKASYKDVLLHFGNPDEISIHVALFIPNDAQGPVPVIMSLNKCGNHTVIDDPRVAETEKPAPDCKKARGSRASLWSIETAIDRGYAVVTYHQSDADVDKGFPWLNLWKDGFHPHFDLPGSPDSHWGAIGAWTWGLHRVVDYLQTDLDIDGTRIAVTGHSRRGKAALWAAATDERIAMAIPHQSGTAGTTLSRSFAGEGVTAMNNFFPHWFNNTFTDFNGCPERLPVDQHLLIAMVAPRPVLVTLGTRDCHSDPAGSIMAVKLASPVYEFLGGMGAQFDNGVVPSPYQVSSDSDDWETKGEDGVVRFDSDLAWAVRAGNRGKHSVIQEDWNLFLDFADVHFQPEVHRQNFGSEPVWTTLEHRCGQKFKR